MSAGRLSYESRSGHYMDMLPEDVKWGKTTGLEGSIVVARTAKTTEGGKTCRAFQSHGRCRKERRQNCGDPLENIGAGQSRVETDDGRLCRAIQRTLGIGQTKAARQPQAEHHTNACQQQTIAAIPSRGPSTPLDNSYSILYIPFHKAVSLCICMS